MNNRKEELQQRIANAEKELDAMKKLLSNPEKITDRVKNYQDILAISGVFESADNIKVAGFDDAENKVVQSLVKKMRIAKVYNEGWLPVRGENRWYPWYDVSSGFVFDRTDYDYTRATSGSAARLCFKSDELARDFAKKFIQIDADFIDLR